jgi:hypothetical protein
VPNFSKRRKLALPPTSGRPRNEAPEEQVQARMQSDPKDRFELAAILRDLDIKAVWMAAEDQERRVLAEQLVE